MDIWIFSIIVARTLIEIIFFFFFFSIFSFLNFVIYRLPRGMQFSQGKSMCTTCKHELARKDLIPIISWVSLRGKCRYCGAKISARYTIVELIGGISAVVCTLVFGITFWALAVFLLSGVVTVALYILYDKLTKRV